MPLDTRLERVVIKIGTSVLVSDGRPDPQRFSALADSLSWLRADGIQLVLVTSGSIAVGMARLCGEGSQAPKPSRQLAAAVGQGLLFETFRSALGERGLRAAQLVLTPPDLVESPHRDGTRSVLEEALDSGLIPVANENDAVMVRNNDVLAALLAATIHADCLVLLTDVPGLYESDPRTNADARRIPEVIAMTPEVERFAGAFTQGLGTGGMSAKLCAAWIATMAGTATVVAGADGDDAVLRAVREPSLIGTLIHPREPSKKLDIGRLWRALSAPAAGRVLCQPDAAEVVAQGGPLSAVHVKTCTGEFAAQDVIDIVAGDSEVIARGRSRIDSREYADLAGDRVIVAEADYVSFLEE